MISLQTIKNTCRRRLFWILCGLFTALLSWLVALPFLHPVPVNLGDRAFELQAGFTRQMDIGTVEFVNVSPDGKRNVEGTRYQLAFVVVWVSERQGGDAPSQ
jgi:hypothetical protein